MQAITATGAQYLEAPVSGSKQPAEQGQLIFLCGGERQLFDKSIPLLEVLGKAHFFLGKVGNGANMVRDGIYARDTAAFMLTHCAGACKQVQAPRESGQRRWHGPSSELTESTAGPQGLAAFLQTHWACSMQSGAGCPGSKTLHSCASAAAGSGSRVGTLPGLSTGAGIAAVGHKAAP